MWQGFNKLMNVLQGKKNPSVISVPLPFSEELILQILSFVPSSDLLNNCIWVKEWQSVIDSNSLWLLKCQHEGKPVPKRKPDPLPENFYRSVYFVPYNENLIKNSSGQDGLKFWTVKATEEYGFNTGIGRSWIAESPPVGTDPIPDTDIQSCFVSSYSWCEKEQCVLLLEHVGEYILDVLKPDISVSESFAARFDCGGIYQCKITLEAASGKILDVFNFEKEETQDLCQWQTVKHVFRDYPEGVRVLRFIHCAKDTQYWAGHYGMKVSCANVSFILET